MKLRIPFKILTSHHPEDLSVRSYPEELSVLLLSSI
jgi:hypothetical protein